MNIQKPPTLQDQLFSQLYRKRFSRKEKPETALHSLDSSLFFTFFSIYMTLAGWKCTWTLAADAVMKETCSNWSSHSSLPLFLPFLCNVTCDISISLEEWRIQQGYRCQLTKKEQSIFHILTQVELCSLFGHPEGVCYSQHHGQLSPSQSHTLKVIFSASKHKTTELWSCRIDTLNKLHSLISTYSWRKLHF